MFLMWFTSKAQLLIIGVLLGLYSWNSFASLGGAITVSTKTKRDEIHKAYSSAQLILLSERLQAVEGDEFQTAVGSSLIELAKVYEHNNLSLSLDALLTKAGNTPIVFNEKFYKYMGNNYVYYKQYFSRADHINFKLSFLKYYFSHYDEFNYDKNLSSNILDFEKLTFQKLEQLIVNDIHLAINDLVNTLLDRNGEYGLKKVSISKDIVRKSLGLTDKKNIITVAQFLDPYLFNLERHLLKRETLNMNKHYEGLRGIIGEFSNEQFFRLIFKKEQASAEANQLNFKNLFTALKDKIRKEFPNFNETILKQRILQENLKRSVVDYVQAPQTGLNGSLIISSFLCGLNENIRAQAFSGNENIQNYCHFNSLYSAFLISKLEGANKAPTNNIVYPALGSLIKMGRNISSQK